MRPDPKPRYGAGIFNSDGSVIFADSNDPVGLHFLEMQRGMRMVRQPEAVILIRQSLNLWWELMVKTPELRGGPGVYSGNGRGLPSRCSRNASSANWSSLPPRMSASIC